jgi:hypothetical protein
MRRMLASQEATRTISAVYESVDDTGVVAP